MISQPFLGLPFGSLRLLSPRSGASHYLLNLLSLIFKPEKTADIWPPPLHGFPAKCGLRNEHRNSPLMTCYYPELGSASDWLKICFNLSKKGTTQIWIVTCHMDSALLPQASSCGKPSLQSRNASRFLGLNLFSQFAMSLLKLAQLKFLSTCFSPGENRRNLVWSTCTAGLVPRRLSLDERGRYMYM